MAEAERLPIDGTPGVSPVDLSAAREGGEIQVGACGERRVPRPDGLGSGHPADAGCSIENPPSMGGPEAALDTVVLVSRGPGPTDLIPPLPPSP